MRRVIIESPYRGDTERNLKYARAALSDSLSRGEAPIASHLLHTQVLNDEVPEDREKGIKAGLAWVSQADAMILYHDFGFSIGMVQAAIAAAKEGIEIEFRTISEEPCISHRWKTIRTHSPAEPDDIVVICEECGCEKMDD